MEKCDILQRWSEYIEELFEDNRVSIPQISKDMQGPCILKDGVRGVNPGGDAGTRPPQISDARDAHVKFPIASPPQILRNSQKRSSNFSREEQKKCHQFFKEGKIKKNVGHFKICASRSPQISIVIYATELDKL